MKVKTQELINSQNASTDIQTQLLKDIENYYLPRQLVQAIFDNGGIPSTQIERKVGVGFIDIADYTFISKFLSPQENQTLLNGLYTAFQIVLERHGGFLNKIEGDSIMFHFDGVIDQRIKTFSPQELEKHIATELFYTCVEMQRVCTQFNNAHESFISRESSEASKQALEAAFDIIKSMRQHTEFSKQLEAFFQIRIRIGASLGDVTVGNFGPDGCKRWDVIGMPVVVAKRMESSAPIGGFRISEDFYKILTDLGVVENYCTRFKREAQALGSVYANLEENEIFNFKQVIIQEKKGALYNTYSVQVTPNLPEALAKQISLLINQGDKGTDRIIQLLQYYRGNPKVINHIEKVFESMQIKLRKADMLRLLNPKKYNAPLGDPVEWEKKLSQVSLSKIFKYMNQYQDLLKNHLPSKQDPIYLSYDQMMACQVKNLREQFRKVRSVKIKHAWFAEVITPLIYTSLRSSIKEYQLDQIPDDITELNE